MVCIDFRNCSYYGICSRSTIGPDMYIEDLSFWKAKNSRSVCRNLLDSALDLSRSFLIKIPTRIESDGHCSPYDLSYMYLRGGVCWMGSIVIGCCLSYVTCGMGCCNFFKIALLHTLSIYVKKTQWETYISIYLGGSSINHVDMEGVRVVRRMCISLKLIKWSTKRGLKCPKNCPHGLWMTPSPYLLDTFFHSSFFSCCN